MKITIEAMNAAIDSNEAAKIEAAAKLATDTTMNAVTVVSSLIAKRNGKIEAYAYCLRCLENDMTVAEIEREMLYSALRSDDTWSGRGNDLKRDWADAYREAIEDMFRYNR